MGVYKVEWSQYCSFLLLAVIATGFIASTSAISTNWWAVGVSGCGRRDRSIEDPCPACAFFRQNNTITEMQEVKCREDHASFVGLSVGARQAIVSCQTQFNNSRWNCSTLRGQHLFGAFIANSHVRETSVLNAYFTVGAISGIAEDCHDQKIQNCPCLVDNARREDEEGNVVFEACKADYSFAAEFIDEFVVSQIDQGEFGGKVDVHNIEVGKQAANVEETSCRCHGVSGTCTVQTCYKHVPTVSDVSPTLYTRYSGAVRVNLTSNGNFVNIVPTNDPPTRNDLVYSDISPDFCRANIGLGTIGVAHRKCNPVPNSPDSCSNLCCGYGHYSKTRVEPNEVCEFVWCCRIECRIEGTNTITDYFCNPEPETSS